MSLIYGDKLVCWARAKDSFLEALDFSSPVLGLCSLSFPAQGLRSNWIHSQQGLDMVPFWISMPFHGSSVCSAKDWHCQ